MKPLDIGENSVETIGPSPPTANTAMAMPFA